MPTIYDNQTEYLAPGLREALAEATALDVCVGYLNLRGWHELAEAVDALPWDGAAPSTRVLVGMAVQPGQQLRRKFTIQPEGETWKGVTNAEIPGLISEFVGELGAQLTVGFPSDQDEELLRRLKRQVDEGRVALKFFACGPLHAKLYLAHLSSQAAPRKGFVGSSNLTLAGLVRQGELNVDVLDKDATGKLAVWFTSQWDAACAVPISVEVVDVIERSWAAEEQLSPYLIYLKIAYELARDAREGIRDYDIPASLADVLLDHQADAVRVASKILERRRGVMIGDVVGLGKTLVATAVARLLQEQNLFETLVVCPKNLVKMWLDHFHKYQILGRVVPLSMAHSVLPDTPRHRLLIVDESHNLRNEETRVWDAVRAYIERNEPHVMLVTATPYNKDYGDVAGQIRLFLDEETDLGLKPETLIEAVGEVAVAQKAGGRLTTLKAFEQSDYPEDWQRLMSLFLIRRTRRFVEDRYGETDDEGRKFLRFRNGTPFYFPKREPRPLAYTGGPSDPGDRLASVETVDELASLVLPRYRLADYFRADAEPETEDDAQAVERLRRARGNLQGFVRTTLLKRLASSGPAFLLSIERHIIRNRVAAHALENNLPFPLGAVESARWDFGADDDAEALPGMGAITVAASKRDEAEWRLFASERYDALRSRRRAGVTWITPSLFERERLIDDLLADSSKLEALLRTHGDWKSELDSKVSALAGLIEETHSGQKVLVFTEYADTASYVAQELRDRLPSISSALATGGTSDPTVLARRFSPVSNDDLGGLPEGTTELQVLVATDVLSEGQNLQDGFVVVNYDLPWAIIRIIQRAGRVDRVGQMSPVVHVYSFLPHDGVEAVIRLRARITQRLRENAKAFESDERFFDLPEDGEEDAIRGLFDGSADLAGDEGPTAVDWSSLAMAIWDDAPEEDRARVAGLPNVVYSTRSSDERDVGSPPGVLIYAKTEGGLDAFAWSTGSEVRSVDPYEALSRARVEPEAVPADRLSDHHALVRRGVLDHVLEALRRPGMVAYGRIQRQAYLGVRHYLDQRVGTFDDTPELRGALEALHRFPLRESAKSRVAKAFRNRTPEDIVQLLLALHASGELVIDLETDEDEIQIVCSLGVHP